MYMAVIGGVVFLVMVKCAAQLKGYEVKIRVKRKVLVKVRHLMHPVPWGFNCFLVFNST